MNKLLLISALLASIGLYGCASGALDIDRERLADLTAKNIGVDDKTVTIRSADVKYNHGFAPPEIYYSWRADTPDGKYRCHTSKGYQMGSVVNQSSGCQKIPDVDYR